MALSQNLEICTRLSVRAHQRLHTVSSFTIDTLGTILSVGQMAEMKGQLAPQPFSQLQSPLFSGF